MGIFRGGGIGAQRPPPWTSERFMIFRGFFLIHMAFRNDKHFDRKYELFQNYEDFVQTECCNIIII